MDMEKYAAHFSFIVDNHCNQSWRKYSGNQSHQPLRNGLIGDQQKGNSPILYILPIFPSDFRHYYFWIIRPIRLIKY